MSKAEDTDELAAAILERPEDTRTVMNVLKAARRTRSLDWLVSLLPTDRVEVVRAVLFVLSELGAGSASVAERVVPFLSSQDPRTRFDVLDVLHANLATISVDALVAVGNLVADPIPAIVVKVMDIYADLGEARWDELARCAPPGSPAAHLLAKAKDALPPGRIESVRAMVASARRRASFPANAIAGLGLEVASSKALAGFLRRRVSDPEW